MSSTEPWPTITRFDSADTTVSKFVFEANDPPAVAEAVLYGYPTHAERTVICCSTQSGCPVGCTFCGTGAAFVRSLTEAEIVAQVDHCIGETGMDAATMGRLQIMFMSMGEPMLNQRHLLPALAHLHERYPAAALLISTSAPRVDYGPIRLISKLIPTIGLQFSVHESTDEARNLLVPFARKLTLAEMATEGREWAEATGRQPFINYCVHDGNNTEADADRLAYLFEPVIFQATLSVICEKDETVRAATERQRALAEGFAAKMAARGYSTRVFDPAGQDDIGGGCGQLWYVQRWMAEHGARSVRGES